MSATRLPGTPRLLRALNDRAALELLLERGPLTRARLGELTGLSKVTASQLVERLEERGLVTRVGEQAGGRGPNAQLYAVRPGSAHVVGVDVGAGPGGGRLRRHHRRGDRPGRAVHPGHRRPGRRGAQRGGAGGRAAPARSCRSVRRIVLGTPGLVDPGTGDITFAFNLPRWHSGLLAALREDLHTPVVFENDVNLAAVAEAQSGAAQGVADFVLVWVGAGVGLAIVLGGRLHHGSSGAAGEIGYLPVPGAPIPRDVSRRAKPAFQQLAGADAVRAVAREHGFAGGRPPPTRCAPPSPPARRAARCSTSWPAGWRSGWPAPAWCSTRRWWCSPARSARPAARRWPSGCSTRSPRSPWSGRGWCPPG